MGEALLVLVGLGLAGYVLLGPAIALALALRASRRADELERQVNELRDRLAERRVVAARPYEAHAIARGPEVSPPIGAVVDPAPREAAPVNEVAAAPEIVPAEEPIPIAAREQVDTPEQAAQPALASDPSAAIPPAAPPPPEPPAPSAKPTLEEHLALTWLTRIGAAAFLLGALFFFKYAVDNAWIGPTGRVAVGGGVGAVILVVAEIIREKTRPRFIHALVGIGLATLFVSIWASAVFYQLVGPGTAFVACTVVLFLGAALSLRYRGEAVLVLVLVAGFANPIVLSTGQDRPLELFSYLLLITSVALAVAVKLRFRVVPVVVVAGTSLLFAGWYARYFDVHDASRAPIDLPPDRLVGAYLALPSRIVPLAFVALASAEWSAAALWLRARSEGKPPVAVRWLSLTALVLAHVGAALLLYDHPRVLAIAAIGLGVSSIALLRAVSATDLLVVPMGAAFAAFVAVSSGVPVDQRTTLVAMLGAWTLVYLVGFMRDVDRRGSIPASAAIASSAGAALFACLAGILLIESRPSLFVLLLAGSSAAVAFVASRADRRELHLAAAVLSAGAIALAAGGFLSSHGDDRLDPVFLAAIGAWALVHLASIADDVLRRGAPFTWGAAITASVASLGFLAAALEATGGALPTLRALLTAAAGVADLALGAAILRARPEARDRVVLLLGQALGLFAAAIALGLSGATITILWAGLAAVAATVAGRARARSWVAISAMLFFATLIRVIFVDTMATHDLVQRFFETAGREGAIAAPVLFNARAYALAGTGVALLVAAWQLSRTEPDPRRRESALPPFTAVAALAATLAWGLLLALAITEVRAAATRLPAVPPYPLDASEWGEFEALCESARAAQRGSLAMLTTLVMALSAAALLAGGFIARSAFHRYLGLLLFAVTVGKLAAWDVWSIERIYQIVLLTGVGALLVGGGFLYARFGQRLVALMREGAPPSSDPPGSGGGRAGAAGVVILASLLALPSGARAEITNPADKPLSTAKLASLRPIAGIGAPGDYRIDVDADLYRASTARDLLSDLRIAGPTGLEVPYVIREVGAPRPVASMTGDLLDPSTGSSGSVFATFRLPARGPHCRAALDLDGTTFLRRVRVETGEDQRSFGALVEGPIVYRIAQEGSSVEHLVVPYPRSEATLVRVTLLPEGEGPPQVIRIRGASFSCAPIVPADPVDLAPLRIDGTERDEAAKTTVITLDAGADGLPIRALSLDVATPEFSRRVDVSATSYRAVWPWVGGGAIYRIAPREGVVIASDRLSISPARKRWLRLSIRDGDSSPLQITGVRGEIRRREIVLRAAAAGEHRLYFGDAAATPPIYDLSAILDQAPRAEPPRQATLGAVIANPAFGKAERVDALPATERYRGLIGAALAALLVALSLWAVRLLRKAEPPA